MSADRHGDAMEKLVRGVIGGPPLAEVAQPSPDTAVILKDFSALADALADLKIKTGANTEVPFAEIVTVACIRWLQLALQDEKVFQEILEADGGKLKQVWVGWKDYLVNDEGEEWKA
jgi:hypothetical protein